jgi:hypothetical protein
LNGCIFLEADNAIGANKTYATWQEGNAGYVLHHVTANRSFVLKTYHSRVKEYLSPLLLHLSYDLLRGVVDEISKGYAIEEEDKKFIADFYKYGYAGLITRWVDEGMKTRSSGDRCQTGIPGKGYIPGSRETLRCCGKDSEKPLNGFFFSLLYSVK